MKKTYKDLSPEEERELVLWLGFFEDSVHNSYVQMKRWEQLKSSWDLQMFFVAVAFVYHATDGLRRFLVDRDNRDDEVWAILQVFREKVGTYKIIDLRNDIVHRERLSKLQVKKGKPLPESPILHLGTYHVDKDEYCFGKHRIKISDSFDLVNQMTQELQTLSSKRLTEFYQNQTGSVEGMIPFTYLHHFPMRED